MFPVCHGEQNRGDTTVRCAAQQEGRIAECPVQGQPDADNDAHVRKTQVGRFRCHLCQSMRDAEREDWEAGRAERENWRARDEA